MFLNVDNVGAERMSSGRLFQATGPATQNARLPSCSLVLGTTKSPRVTNWNVLAFCSTGFGECLIDEPNHNLAYQYQFSDYPPTIDRRRSASLYTKGPVYQKLPGSAYTADEQCAQTFEHETRRCPYMVIIIIIIIIMLKGALHKAQMTTARAPSSSSDSRC